MGSSLVDGFFSELAGILLNKEAKLKPSVTLQPQQEDIVSRSRTSPGMIANWGLGSGKTIGSLAVAEEKGGNVLVVVPASLRTNYRTQMAANVEPSRHKAYTVISYDAFRADPEGWIAKVKPTTLIADEFHRLRNPAPREPFEKVRSKVPFMLGLTGSLVNNRPEEIVPLTNLVAGRPVFRSEEDFDRRFIAQDKVSPGILGRLKGVKPGIRETVQNEQVLGRILAPFIHRFSGDEEYKKHVPQVVEKRVNVEMTPRQEEMLKALKRTNPVLDYRIRHNLPASKAELKNLNSFMTGARQISNNPQAFSVRPTASPKLEKMFADLHTEAAKDPRFKAVVYSNFIESGIAPLIDNLKAKGVNAEAFTGGLNDKQRQMLVDRFNKGHIRVLGLSPAGGEGLDLKGVKLVQLTEEHWNPERTRQAIGRSARFKSHEALPPEERKVQVNRYLSVHPPPGFFARLFGAKRPMSPDEWINARRQEKLDLNQAVVNAIPQFQRKAASVTMQQAFTDELQKLGVSKSWIGMRMVRGLKGEARATSGKLWKSLLDKTVNRTEVRDLVRERLRRAGKPHGALVNPEIDATLFSRIKKDPAALEEYQKAQGSKVAAGFADEIAKLAVSEGKVVRAIFGRAYAGKQIVPTINRMADNYVATSRRMGSSFTRQGLKKWISQVKETGKV